MDRWIPPSVVLSMILLSLLSVVVSLPHCSLRSLILFEKNWIWFDLTNNDFLFFHSAYPTVGIKWNWTMYVCMYVCPLSLRRWSLFLLTDHYNHTYSESLWWKLFKNHKRTQIQIQRQWKDNDNNKGKDKVPEKPNMCYIFEILMTYSKNFFF